MTNDYKDNSLTIKNALKIKALQEKAQKLDYKNAKEQRKKKHSSII